MKDEMKIGYIRISKAGPNRKEQESALRTVGIEDFSVAGTVYVDDPEKAKDKMTQLPSREAAIAGYEPVMSLLLLAPVVLARQLTMS